MSCNSIFGSLCPESSEVRGRESERDGMREVVTESSEVGEGERERKRTERVLKGVCSKIELFLMPDTGWLERRLISPPQRPGIVL